MKRIYVVQIDDHALFQREKSKLGTNHPYGGGNLSCHALLPSEIIAKVLWRLIGIFLSRNTGSISPKPGTKYPWVKGI